MDWLRECAPQSAAKFREHSYLPRWGPMHRISRIGLHDVTPRGGSNAAFLKVVSARWSTPGAPPPRTAAATALAQSKIALIHSFLQLWSVGP